MPYAEGESLRDLLDRETTLPAGQAIKLMQDILAALAHAHEHGVVHRDMKPANILLVDGQALVADFGISMGSSTADGQRLTEVGLAVGTPTYMSPEQIEGSRSVDLRTDIYAMACILYEMLTGSPPFTGPSVHAIIAKAMTEEPPAVHAVRPEVPAGVDEVISRALATNAEDRFASAREFADALELEAAPAPARPWQRAAIAGLVVVATVLGFTSWQNSRRSAARESLPRIAELAAAGAYAEAFELAVAAERVIPADATLDSLMMEVSDLVSVTTEPPDAQVAITAFDPGGVGSEPVFSGTAPVEQLRVPRVDHLVQVTRDGYVPTERLADSRFLRSPEGRRDRPEIGRDITLALVMLPQERAPREAVFIPGGAYQLVGPDVPTMASTDLRDYRLDKFEVTNAEFRSFILERGYDEDVYWTGVPVSVRSSFTDRTDLPGPRDWVGQQFPDGQDRHPVTGVTWHEASAFCASPGSRLPTAFEWEKADRNGLRVTLSGTMMPWGPTSSASIFENRANFSSSGTTPVDAYPFGISQHGAHGMAGNAREWLLNEMGDGYTVTGGSWEDPSYLYPQFGSQPGTFSSRSLGFRCARALGGDDSGQGSQPFDLDNRTPTYSPVDPTAFRRFLDHYTYDRQPANPRGRTAEESEGWVRERFWIDGVDGDSVLVYFYTPTQGAPPYQTMVYVPGSSTFCCNKPVDGLEYLLGPVIRGGRAAAAVVMHGMLERPFPPGFTPPATNSVRFRDLMVRHATELRLGVDYLEQRDEVDMSKLVYVGHSWGAGSRIGFAAIEPRFEAFVLLAGGIDERVKPTLPEADNVNFAPYIDGPKILINGTNDDEHPWPSRGLPMWTLLSEPKELVLIEGAGHVAPLEERVPAVNGFLDRTLGPVQRR
jgi:formylglycine-generating enzyme required for sulfatase activity